MDTRAAAVVIDSGDRHHCVLLKNEVETQKYTKIHKNRDDERHKQTTFHHRHTHTHTEIFFISKKMKTHTHTHTMKTTTRSKLWSDMYIANQKLSRHKDIQFIITYLPASGKITQRYRVLLHSTCVMMFSNLQSWRTKWLEIQREFQQQWQEHLQVRLNWFLTVYCIFPNSILYYFLIEYCPFFIY